MEECFLNTSLLFISAMRKAFSHHHILHVCWPDKSIRTIILSHGTIPQNYGKPTAVENADIVSMADAGRSKANKTVGGSEKIATAQPLKHELEMDSHCLEACRVPTLFHVNSRSP